MGSIFTHHNSLLARSSLSLKPLWFYSIQVGLKSGVSVFFFPLGIVFEVTGQTTLCLDTGSHCVSQSDLRLYPSASLCWDCGYTTVFSLILVAVSTASLMLSMGGTVRFHPALRKKGYYILRKEAVEVGLL